MNRLLLSFSPWVMLMIAYAVISAPTAHGIDRADASGDTTVPARACCSQLAFAGRGKRLPVSATVNCVSLSPDGTRGLAASGDTLILWDFPAGKVIYRLEAAPGHPLTGDIYQRHYEIERAITCMAVDWKSQVVVTGNGRGTLQVWDISKGKLLRAIQANEYRPNVAGELTAVAVSFDGQRIYSSGFEKGKRDAIKVWDLRSGKQLQTIAQAKKAREGLGAYAYILPLKDGQRALLDGFEGLVLWDLVKDTRLSTLNVPDATLLTATDAAGKLLTLSSVFPRLVVRGSKGQELRTLLRIGVDNDPPTHEPSAMAFVPPDGKKALTGGRDGDLMLWDVDRGKLVAAWKTSTYQEAVQGIAISANAKYALTGSKNGVVQLWEMATGKVLGHFTLD